MCRDGRWVKVFTTEDTGGHRVEPQVRLESQGENPLEESPVGAGVEGVLRLTALRKTVCGTSLASILRPQLFF
jgi:hypothetical protein